MQNKWKVEMNVDVRDIELTEVNANVMSPEEFKKLCANIKKSGMSSMITCYKSKDTGKYIIISGNHRYRACVKLGYKAMNIITTDEENLTRDEVIAVQLSHNSLHGSDDKNILKRLLDEIKDLDFKDFAHINTDDVKIENMFDNVSASPMAEHYAVKVLLYKNDIDNILDLMIELEESKNSGELVIMADKEDTEAAFLETMDEVKRKYDIKSSSIALSKIFELAKICLESLEENTK